MSRITTSVYDYDEKTVIFTIFFSECRLYCGMGAMLHDLHEESADFEHFRRSLVDSRVDLRRFFIQFFFYSILTFLTF